MKVEIKPATIEHAKHIAENARADDVRELWATSMSKPFYVMERGICYSDFALTGMVDGEPVMMWGIVNESMIGRIGIPWMVGSKKLDDVAVTFLRRCRAPLVAAMAGYSRLVNYVDSRNVRAIQWLKWLGFVVNEVPEPYGVLKLPFHKFEMVGGKDV